MKTAALCILVLSLFAIPLVLMFAGPLVSAFGISSGPSLLLLLTSPLFGALGSFAYLERV